MNELAGALLAKIIEREEKVAIAESCTGGLLTAALTDVPGSSEAFDMGMISYSNDIKARYLGVSQDILDKEGAVSAPVASQMVIGIRLLADAELGISITGIAGPGGGSAEKPVGLVYIGSAYGERVIVGKYLFQGNRQEIRQQSVEAALQQAISMLDNEEA